MRIFDYPRWAEPLRYSIRQYAERVAREHGLTIEFIRELKSFRKEDRIQAIPAQRAPPRFGPHLLRDGNLPVVPALA